MKNYLLKYAGLMLVATLMLAAFDADAGGRNSGRNDRNDRHDSRGRGHDRDRDDDRGRGHDRDCDRDRDRDRDCDDDDDNTPTPVDATIGIAPVGSLTTAQTAISITAPYTAPANSSAA